MPDKESFDSVCDELDELAVKMLELMKQYIDLKLTLEELVKTGSLDLAKSRYIMGNKSVSVLQLPTEDSEVNARTKVVTVDDSVDELKFELSRLSLSPQAESFKSSADDNENSGLKKRKGGKKIEVDEETSSDTMKKVLMQDPLRWFGVLVPRNLRSAQSSFNKAIEITIELANVQLEMDSVRHKYSDFLLKKKELSE